MNLDPMEIINFWFDELSEKDWFSKSDALDDMIRHRFLEHLRMAEKGELFIWRIIPEGRLAEIIILDQFSRNIYRGEAHAFKNDTLALALAQELVILGIDKKLPDTYRKFAYMPFMHSESRLVHEVAMNLFQELGDKEALRYEELHKEIIDEYGRFPHRNKALGRNTTMKEQKFLTHHRGF